MRSGDRPPKTERARRNRERRKAQREEPYRLTDAQRAQADWIEALWPSWAKMQRVATGGAEGRKAQRDDRERDRVRLLEAVADLRTNHPKWSRMQIARELVAEHGREPDRADPRDYEKRVAALTKRIERAEPQ